MVLLVNNFKCKQWWNQRPANLLDLAGFAPKRRAHDSQFLCSILSSNKFFLKILDWAAGAEPQGWARTEPRVPTGWAYLNCRHHQLSLTQYVALLFFLNSAHLSDLTLSITSATPAPREKLAVSLFYLKQLDTNYYNYDLEDFDFSLIFPLSWTCKRHFQFRGATLSMFRFHLLKLPKRTRKFTYNLYFWFNNQSRKLWKLNIFSRLEIVYQSIR